MKEQLPVVVMDFYDEYVRSVDDPAGVKVSDVKMAIWDQVKALVSASDRDLDRETSALVNMSVTSERSKRSRSLPQHLDRLLNGIPEAGEYVDPMLDMAFGLGDEHGVDKTLRNWTAEDFYNLTVVRYRVAAETTKAASQFDEIAQQLVSRMRAMGAFTVGEVEWAVLA